MSAKRPPTNSLMCLPEKYPDDEWPEWDGPVTEVILLTLVRRGSNSILHSHGSFMFSPPTPFSENCASWVGKVASIDEHVLEEVEVWTSACESRIRGLSLSKSAWPEAEASVQGAASILATFNAATFRLVEALAAALQHEAPRVRLEVLAALAHAATPEARKLAARAAADSTPSVAQLAASISSGRV